ncbi:MAG: CBS domain-containing protein, partial [Desulfobacca sp.]|nr:CBS domain-containing protein [Desulfobacca sp.]
LITDGDLRRALVTHEDIRLLQAADCMTPNPITITPEISLKEAAHIMEDRPSQISVLPVMESGGKKCLGLVRIHDIYQPELV